MDRKIGALLIAAIVAVSAIVIYVEFSEPDYEPHDYELLEANEDVFQIEDFDLADEKTGSWIRGTLYAMNGDDGSH